MGSGFDSRLGDHARVSQSGRGSRSRAYTVRVRLPLRAPSGRDGNLAHLARSKRVAWWFESTRPDHISYHGDGSIRLRLLRCQRSEVGSTPIVPAMGPSFNGRMSGLHPDDEGSIPSGSTMRLSANGRLPGPQPGNASSTLVSLTIHQAQAEGLVTLRVS